MATVRHLAHAPIKEALIDFHIKSVGSVNAIALKPLVDAAKSLYGNETTIRQFSGPVMDAQEGKFLSSTEEVHTIGFALSNASKSSILQFRIDGFTHNRLTPYQSWSEFFPEAMHW